MRTAVPVLGDRLLPRPRPRSKFSANLVLDFLAAVLLGLAFAPPALAAETPQPVSPGSRDPDAVALAELRCPTFSWAGVEGAPGYELAIFRVSGAPDTEPILVTRTVLPRNAETWTPALHQCLERGERYAWSVAAARPVHHTASALEWAPALLFEVDAAPSSDELEQAVETLQRYLATRGARDPSRDADESPQMPDLGSGADPVIRRDADRDTDPGDGRSPSVLPRAPLARGTPPASPAATRVAAAASAPTLGTPSLSLAGNLSLSASSNLFKNDDVFLWDDTDGNTALGRDALASVTLGVRNTAVGRRALERTTGSYGNNASDNTAIGDGALRYNTTGRRNTATGALALHANTSGRYNVASGYQALRANTTGSSNVAAGAFALYDNTEGFQNIAIGISALRDNTTAYHNTAVGTGALSRTTGGRNLGIGRYAGFHTTTGVDNIHIGSGAIGVAGETHTIRIGGVETGTAQFQQNRTFINGIRGVTTALADAQTVVIDSAGQLGTTNSSRALKQDITPLEELGSLADRLLALRPVAFRYKQHAETDPDTPLEFGLIADEVAEVFPELVIFDRDGKPQTVKYHLLSSLLLGELQQQHDSLEGQSSELARIRSRLGALESCVIPSEARRTAPR